MKHQNNEDWTSYLGESWNLLISLIGFLIFIILLLLGYLLLQEEVHDVFKTKPKQVESTSLLAQYRKNNVAQDPDAEWDRVENGIHIRTGMKDDANLQTVIGACTSCHSSKLITQNRATRKGWKSMIRWMQKTQGLGDLGSAEPIILDYLAKYYAPQETGRRKKLNQEDIEWFVLHTEK